MSRSYTIAELKTRIRRAADLVNSNFVIDAELLDYINNSYARLYNRLVGADQNYFTSSYSFAINTTTDAYALPSDFYKILAVELLVANNTYVTIRQFNEAERNHLTVRTSLPSSTIRLRYVPQPTKFTSDVDTVDGISGFEEYIVMDGAIQCGIKEETDTSPLERRLGKIEREIDEIANNRDMLFNGATTDIYRVDVHTHPRLKYRLYGSNLEFVSTEVLSTLSWY